MAIINGRIRGGGRQLGYYLLSDKDNEEIRILYVDGQRHFTESDFKDLLTDFSRNELLTRSKQGVYHSTYNPAEGVAARLTDDEWLKAAEIIAGELPFKDQRRAVVLQKNKAGRYHIHIAIERFDHEKGKMIPIPHNYRCHDRARVKLEQLYNEQPTQRRNASRAEMKKCLTELWLQNTDASSFIKQAKQQGYVIAKAYAKGQYVAVDETARAFKLVSHLEGVRIGEVRERFKDMKLIGEKEAVAFAASQKAITTKAANPRQTFLNTLTEQRNKQKSQKPRMHL